MSDTSNNGWKKWQVYLAIAAILATLGWNVFYDRLSMEKAGSSNEGRIANLEKEIEGKASKESVDGIKEQLREIRAEQQKQNDMLRDIYAASRKR